MLGVIVGEDSLFWLVSPQTFGVKRDYSWSLQELRDETTRRCIYFPRKDGVKTLASRLRPFDWLGQSSGDEGKTRILRSLLRGPFLESPDN